MTCTAAARTSATGARAKIDSNETMRFRRRRCIALFKMAWMPKFYIPTPTKKNADPSASSPYCFSRQGNNTPEVSCDARCMRQSIRETSVQSTTQFKLSRRRKPIGVIPACQQVNPRAQKRPINVWPPVRTGATAWTGSELCCWEAGKHNAWELVSRGRG